MRFVNVFGNAFNTVHPNDFHYYEEVNNVAQYEPNEAYSPEILGQLASIGIEKGKSLAPDERMKKILTQAAAVGNATARTIAFRSREDGTYIYPDSPGNRRPRWSSRIYQATTRRPTRAR